MKDDRKFPPVEAMREKYFMVKRLGGGSFGTVYLVKTKEKKEHFAAKHQRSQEARQRGYVRRELELLEILRDHPSVVSLKDFYESGLESVIVTEYLSGGELFERISSKEYDLTESKCKGFMRQVLEGLVYIHSQDIVHLDLKPNNLVCVSRDSGDQRVKIIDFGLARSLQGCPSIGISMVGTLEFMAPEVLSCRGASTASDMWSVGVIVFMMVTGGFSPFYYPKTYKTQRMILRGNYDIEQFGGSVSREAKDLVRALLTVSPNDRLSAADCLNHSWFGGRGVEPDSEVTETVRRLETQAMRRWLARRRWIRACHIVRATIRLNSLGQENLDTQPEYFSSEEVWI